MSKYFQQIKAVESMQDQCMWMMWIVQRFISTTYINTVSIACSAPVLNTL